MRIFTQDIGMEIGIEKYATLIIRSGKRPMTHGTKLLNQEKIRRLGEKDLGILEADTIKLVGMKEKIKKN